MGPLVLSSPPPPVVCTLFIWLVAGVVLRENTGAWFVLRGKVLLVANKPSEHEGVGGVQWWWIRVTMVMKKYFFCRRYGGSDLSEMLVLCLNSSLNTIYLQ